MYSECLVKILTNCFQMQCSKLADLYGLVVWLPESMPWKVAHAEAVFGEVLDCGAGICEILIHNDVGELAVDVDAILLTVVG